jgi:hypothetical protein
MVERLDDERDLRRGWRVMMGPVRGFLLLLLLLCSWSEGSRWGGRGLDGVGVGEEGAATEF